MTNAIIITKGTALKYFGKKDPIGKVIKPDNTNLTVSGLICDFRPNTRIDFNLLMPMNYFENI